MAIDFTRKITPDSPNQGYLLLTHYEEPKGVTTEDLLIAQKMSSRSNCYLPYQLNYVINCCLINTDRRNSQAVFRFALMDVYNFGYLQGVRAEREKRRSKISKGE